MTPTYIIIIALSIAFVWINVFNRWNTKPFNCLMCLTGWVSLILGCAFYGWYGLFFLPVGMLTGAMFEAITGKYL